MPTTELQAQLEALGFSPGWSMERWGGDEQSVASIQHNTLSPGTAGCGAYSPSIASKAKVASQCSPA
jgi:hypothetical protein